jgi:hypothetical protein
MLLLLLPLPWLLMGLLAAGIRRRGRPGCVCIGGVFVWPQAQLLQWLGISAWMAWLLSLGAMAIFAVVGYLLGMRLFPLTDRSEPPDG